MGRPTGESADTTAYATLNLIYAGLLGSVALAGRRRPALDLAPAEPATLALATFALSKLIAREQIGAWVREPFVEQADGDQTPHPTGTGMRRVMGELVTCSRCVGAWSAAGLIGLRVVAPETGRSVVLVLACAGANDFLQAGFRTLCKSANSG